MKKVTLALLTAFTVAGCNEDFICKENGNEAKLTIHDDYVSVVLDGQLDTDGVVLKVKTQDKGGEDIFGTLKGSAQKYCSGGIWPGLNGPG